jgi:radical SAM protein with 4Fe4S-binding SPASM domain
MISDLLNRVTIPSRLALIYRSGETLGYNPVLNVWHRLNEQQAEVLRWLRAGRPRAHLAAHLTKRFRLKSATGVPLDSIVQWCVLRRLLYCGNEPTPLEIASARSPLIAVYWITTQACNLRCTYCYQDALKARPGELTTDEAKDLIDQTAEAGARVFIFTGGEPFVRRDLLDLARYSKSRGLHTNIITNGHYITRKNVGEVAEVFDLVSVSLDHIHSEHHDRHRGTGSWARAFSAVDTLLEAGVSVDINSVLSRLGLKDITDFLRWRRSKPINQHRIVPQFPMGRGALPGNDELSPEDLLGLPDDLHNINSRLDADEPPLDNDLPHSFSDAGKGQLRNHCGAGLSEVSVDPQGWVYPCKLLQYAEHRGQNIRHKRLKEIYNEDQRLKAARSNIIDNMYPCKTCIIKISCGGGCRGIHRSFTQETTKSFPLFCGYLRRSFEVQAWASTGTLPPARTVRFQNGAA